MTWWTLEAKKYIVNEQMISPTYTYLVMNLHMKTKYILTRVHYGEPGRAFHLCLRNNCIAHELFTSNFTLVQLHF